MITYSLKRLLLMIPTLFGIMALNFFIVQMVPGGPIDTVLAKLRQEGGLEDIDSTSSKALADQLNVQFGFDQPPLVRFQTMIVRYFTFDFGYSYFQEKLVSEIIWSKLPASLSLSCWTLILIYLMAIPLGIQKALRSGTSFDLWTSLVVVSVYAIPSFLFALFLMIFFAGGHFFSFFPLKGLTSDFWETLSFWGKLWDYLWHLTLPVLSLVLGGFAKTTLLTKNLFLEEQGKPYVMAAYAKGASVRGVLYGHLFRNAFVGIIANIPTTFIGILLTSSLLIEVLFSLDGLGLLAFESTFHRDYPVVFALLYLFTFVTMILYLIRDLLYMIVDPRVRSFIQNT